MRPVDRSVNRRQLLALGVSALAPACVDLPLQAQPAGVDPQPFFSQTRRIIDALEYLGRPLREEDLKQVRAAMAQPGKAVSISAVETALDRYALLVAMINPESRVSVSRGSAVPELIQNGWQVFLVKVINQAGVTSRLSALSPQALPDSGQSPGSGITPTGLASPLAARPHQTITEADVSDRWLDLEMFDGPPLAQELSGLLLEYRIIQLYSRDQGKREADISLNAGPATEDIGFRNSVPIVFSCRPASPVQLRIRDADGTPTTCSIVITDPQGRIYPSRAKRLAPDFPFQKQIYRTDSESIYLPEGRYALEFSRGPEYLLKRQTLDVRSRESAADLQLERWIDPGLFGWHSGDHHIHAAGCRHYNTPSEGVLPKDMAPQVRGEGLSFGEVLSWGPCWYYQKHFFTGRIDSVSNRQAALRYDVEISGFPSSYWGHLVLLRLEEENFPGAESLEQWPSWSLPILKWAKSQGAITGYAHSGHGLVVASQDLPNYEIPPFDDNGANEFLIDVTHGAVDFLSAADTPARAELNLWYHTLNCGFQVPIAGETDFPCLFEKVGIGRTYVRMNAKPYGETGYRDWIQGLKSGRSYVSDGRSHFLEMSVNGHAPGEQSETVALHGPSSVRVTAKVAAYLSPQPAKVAASLQAKSWNESPFWHIERARIGESRSVRVELVVNGRPVASRIIEANGQVQEIDFEPLIDRSSWLAVRILPSSHSNPVYISVQGKPVRASRQSVRWCLSSIDAAWKLHGPRIAPLERASAAQVFEEAKNSFRKILAETSS